jgi:hypothetical protein
MGVCIFKWTGVGGIDEQRGSRSKCKECGLEEKWLQKYQPAEKKEERLLEKTVAER